MKFAFPLRFFPVCLFAIFLCLFFGACGSSSSTNENPDTSDTRDMTGSLVQASIPLPSLKRTSNQSATSCSDVQICCNGYDGTTVVETLSSDCTFTIALPLDSFCFCGFFTGSDADGDDCFDDYLGSLGCADDGYAGAIPIFADASGSVEDAINTGSGEIQGNKVVSSTDICSQVDQDGDGFADADDADDDDDSVGDEDDIFNSAGCEGVLELDTDNDDVPDIFEDLWSLLFATSTDDFFIDNDADDVPDGCDEEVGGVTYDCAATVDDTDGDCIADIYDFSLEDEDQDGLAWDIDCDDNDASIGFDCYDVEGTICDLDLDGDMISFCDDCNDFDAYETRTNGYCDVLSCAADSSVCYYDFDCQLFADDYDDDAYETDNVYCLNGCCELIAAHQ